MGTDRKGPLTAFVVIAVVAAILLVTSVRSQADPTWLDHDVPATVVAGPPTGDLHPWEPVAPPVRSDLEVQAGVVLDRRAVPGAAGAQDPATVVAVAGDPTYAGTEHAGTPTGTTAPAPAPATSSSTSGVVRHTRTPHHATSSTAPASGTSQATQAAVSSATPQHGRHLGWSHASGARAGHGRHRGWTRHL